MPAEANNGTAQPAGHATTKKPKKARQGDENGGGDANANAPRDPDPLIAKLELAMEDLRASVDVLAEDLVPKVTELADWARAQKISEDSGSQQFANVVQKLLAAQQVTNTHAAAQVAVLRQFASIFASADGVTRKRFRRMMQSIERADNGTGRSLTISYRAVLAAVAIAAIMTAAYMLGGS
jgi:hypothetical protein